MFRLSGIPEWSDAAAYWPLLDLERPAFAWEWLRRNPGYQAAARHVRHQRATVPFREEEQAAAEWGLHAFENPEFTALDARPVWTAERHPFVLRATAEEDGTAADQFDLSRFVGLATMVSGRGVGRLLLADGLRSVRMDVAGGDLRSGPVCLRYTLRGIATAEPPLLVLRRLISLVASGRFSKGLHPPDPRGGRHLLMLRAYDGLRAGASQREIAAELLRNDALQDRWRDLHPSLRSRAQRLVVAARRMADGAFWRLLA